MDTIISRFMRGQEIFRARKTKGFSQEELAKQLGLAKQTIQKYEKGDIDYIPLATRKKIADILNMDINLLLSKEEREAANYYNQLADKEDEKIVLFRKNYTDENWQQLLQIAKIMAKPAKPAPDPQGE